MPSTPVQWSQSGKAVDYNYAMKEEPVSSPSPGVEVISWPASATLSGMTHQANLAVEDFLHQSQHLAISGHSHPASGPVSTSGSSYGPGHFPCETCGKVYRYKGNLSSHVRLECGKERQFQCPHCPHKSKQKIHLIRHIRSKHQGNQQHAPPVMGLASHAHHQNILPHASLAWHPHIPPPQVMLQVAASTQVGETALEHHRDQQQSQSSSQLSSHITQQQSQVQQLPHPSQQQHVHTPMRSESQQQQTVTPSQTSPPQLSSPSSYTPSSVSRATTP